VARGLAANGSASSWNAWQPLPKTRQEYVMMRPNSYPEVLQADQADPSASALQAVQVALDRRDNGGDAAAAGDE
jgi:hypothetical protein